MSRQTNCPFYEKCNHIDCDGFCLKRFKLSYYLDNAFIPENRRKRIKLFIDDDNSDLEAFTKLDEIDKNIVSFANEGKNLFIYSQNTGNGKSSWCFRMCLTYIGRTWSHKSLYPIVMFISVPRFLIELKQNINERSPYVESILKNATKADLVIWDDVGSKNGTEFEVSNMLSIIDQRLADNKANIYTSNLCGEDLHTALGDRLYSRIYNNSDCIELKGKDKRGIKL